METIKNICLQWIKKNIYKTYTLIYTNMTETCAIVFSKITETNSIIHDPIPETHTLFLYTNLIKMDTLINTNII